MLASLIFFNICLGLQAIKHVSAQLVKPESPFYVATEPTRFFWRSRGTERFAGRETQQPPPRVTHTLLQILRDLGDRCCLIIWHDLRCRGPTDDVQG